MESRYPDATREEVGRMGDGSCVICREEMIVDGDRGGNGVQTDADGTTVPSDQLPESTRPRQGGSGSGGPNETPKKLACGHVFHFHCLRSWLERQQSCPTW